MSNVGARRFVGALLARHCYSFRMQDKRVVIFRTALDELVASLDATLRVMRWEGTESIPEPLQECASHLVTRLGTADRLANGVFKGRPQDVTRVAALTGAMRRLEAAYVDFRRTSTSPTDRAKAETALLAAIDEVKAESQAASS
jgi:hypothetical protein